MDSTRRLARKATQRALFREIIARAGVTLVAGAALALLAVLVLRIAASSITWPLVLVVALVASAVVGVLWAWSSRPTPVQAAAEVDSALGLKDSLASALLLDPRTRSDGFAAWTADRADAIAAEADLRRAIALRFGRPWAIWPALAALTVVAGLWLPADLWGLLRPSAGGPPRPTAQAVQQAVQQLAAARQLIEQSPPASVPGASSAREVEVLRQIEQQLTEGRATPQQARQQAAAELERLAEEARRRAEQSQAARDALRDRLARTRPSSREGESPLTRALRSGDADAARRAAEELSRDMQGMSAEDRKALADQLDALAGQLEAPPSKPDATASMPADTLPPEVREAVRGQTDPTQVEKTLRDNGVPPEQAEQLSRQIAEQNQQQQAERSAEQQARDISESLRDAARELRDPAKPSSPTTPQPPRPDPSSKSGSPDGKGQPSGSDQSNPSRTPEPGKPPDSQKGVEPTGGPMGEPKGDQPVQPGEQAKPGPSDSQKGQGSSQPTPSDSQPQPSQQPTGDSPTPGKQPDPAGQKGQPPAQSQPGQPSNNPQGTPEPGSPKGDPQQGQLGQQQRQPQPAKGQPGQPGSEQKSPAGQPSQQAPQSGGNPGEQGKQPSPTGQPNPGQPTGGEPQPAQNGTQPQPSAPGQPGTPSPGNAPAPSSGSQGMQKLLDAARRMAEQSRQPQQDARQAEQMRQEAQKLWDQASPEERRQMQEWARQMADRNKGSDAPDVPPNGPGGQPQNLSPGGTHAGNEPGDRTPTTPRPPPSPDSPTHVIDARPKSPVDAKGPERIVAEWLGKGGKRTPEQQAEMQQVLRDAAAGGEKAIEDRTLPNRFDSLLRRYFRRLPEQLGAPPPGPAGEPVPARDAPPR